MKVLSSKELNDVTGANGFTDFLEVAYPTTQGAADAAILGSAGMIIGRPVEVNTAPTKLSILTKY